MTPDEIVSKLVAEARRHGLEEEVATQLCPVAYLVYTGSYSDTAVRGVFLSQARAEEFMKKFNDDERVVPMELRSIDNVLDPGCFIHNTGLEAGDDGRTFYDEETHVSPALVRGWWWGYSSRWVVNIYGYGRTEEHAMRSAQQKKRELLALGYDAEKWCVENKIEKV